MQINKNAFTLIELLVVILIIGILVAVALPQYKIAVLKSRYATIKNLVDSLAKANEIYYLANGKYTHNIEDLDVDTPAGIETKELSANVGQRTFNWGKCVLSSHDTSAYVSCELQRNGKIELGYQRYLQHSTASKKLLCIAGSTDLSADINRTCKNETNQQTPDHYPGNVLTAWVY